MTNIHPPPPFQRLLRQSLIILIARILGAMTGFTSMWLIARTFGAVGMAQISVALSLAMLLSACCTAQIEAGSIRFMTRYQQQDATDKLNGYIRFTQRTTCVLSLFIVGIAIVSLETFAASKQTPVLLYAVFAAPILAFVRLQAGYFMGYGYPLHAILPRTFLRPFLFCISVCLILFLTPTPKPVHIMVALTLTAIGVAVLQWWLLRPFKAIWSPHTANEFDRYDWLKTGCTLGLNVLFIEYGIAISILMASTVLSPTELAQFDIALRIIGLFRFAMVASNQALIPPLAQAITRQDQKSCQKLMQHGACLRLAACILGTGFTMLIGPHLLASFGTGFEDAFPVLMILLAEPVLITVFGPGAAILAQSEHPFRIFPTLGMTLVCLFILTPLIGSIWGTAGTAAAYIAARTIWDATLAYKAYRTTGINPTVMAF